MLKRILSRKIKKIFTMKTLFVVLNLLFVFVVSAVILFTDIDEVLKVLAFIIAFMIFKAVENLFIEISREKQKILIPKKRFTHKNDDTGTIEVRKEDFQQAILFLYEVENQIALKR